MLRIVLWTLCAAAIASGDAYAQNYHYGANAHDLRPLVADKMTELGAGTVRVVFGWDVLEPSCKGCFTWSATDAWRDESRRTKVAIFATLAYVPSWANGGRHYNYPPLRIQDWYDFVYAAASRYKDDIFLWGVWNEPNLDAYLYGADLATYESIVRTARSAIRAANPLALVLGPEVSHHAITSGWYAAAMKAFGDQFDIVTAHWFRDFGPLESFLDEGVRPFSMFKSVWLTETGLRPCDSSFGETGQAVFYDSVLRAFEPRRSWWTTVLFYVLYDPPSPLDCGSGIVRPDWTNRPAFSALQAFIRAKP
jgi:putative glycosyl hydrolase